MSRRPLLIVDGYNVIGTDPAYAAVAERDLESARAMLVRDAASFAAGGWRCTVVFDGAGNPRSDGVPHKVAGVTVVFSPHGRTADTIVEALAMRARERGEAVTVVSSDAATQYAVMREGVSRMSSREFAGAMAEEASEKSGRSTAGGRRGPVEDRIDPAVRERLDRWAKGAE